MPATPQILFTGFDPSPVLRDLVEDKIEDLEDHYPPITIVRVVVSVPHRHHQKGRLFDVHIQIGIPGDELVIDHQPGRLETHEDPARAVLHAFKAAARRLQTWQDREMGKVKFGEERPIGHVARLDYEQGFGFLCTVEGREIYFHHNAVPDGGFAVLEVGDRVSFIEEEGLQGPQATSVQPAGALPLLPVEA